MEWLLPNRVGFPKWIAGTFKYSATSSDPRGLYVHQRFVRDYLQPASPYRGLLLYHGLGVGKTCASIAIADVLHPHSSSSRNVYVMLPAVLRGNFLEEVRKCGDPRFIPEQRWREVEGGFEASEDGVAFADLSGGKRDAIKAQIDRDILSAYKVVHYNGMSSKIMHALCVGEHNVFDDSVVIIDEAPNAISRVMHGKLFAHVYQRIMDAERCKVVLLSGTPLVNMPRELAYITNLTHGYIREVTFSAIASAVNVTLVMSKLESHPCVDHVSSEILSDGSSITATMLPNGFIHQPSGFVSLSPQADRPADLVKKLRALVTESSGFAAREPSIQDRFLLPIDSEKFDASFIEDDEKVPQVLNSEVLARRILGNISVYSSTDPTLMPSINPAKIIRVEMSDTQYEEYLIQRDIERRKERAAARFAKVSGGDKDTESKNMYRAFSRSVCTFVFPEGIKRPYKRDLYRTMNDTDDDNENDDAEGVTVKKVERVYERALDSALGLIDADSSTLLTVSGDLPKLSPKYMSIVTHLLEPTHRRHPAIIYSQFRRAEGLGLLRLVLIANGFSELRVLKRRGTLVAEIHPEDADRDSPKFIVYGNDDVDTASAMLKIFNSQLEDLSSDLSDSLGSLISLDGEDGNRHGEIARLLLITQSGSEGISTKNVREVHIVEPFWHANRILQVVGRAARANSHIALPPSERTVDVFVYAATFTDFQASNVTITKLDKKRTSDEHILALATQKRILLDRFTDVMRRAAVDCVLHYPKSAGTRCFSHNAVTINKGDAALAFHTDLAVDIASQGRRVRLVPFKLEDGRLGMADALTGDVYDKNTFKKLRKLLPISRRRPSSIKRFKQ